LNINSGKLPFVLVSDKAIRNMQGFAFDQFAQGRNKRGGTGTVVPGPPQSKYNHLTLLKHFLL
jgi:hypothetical protein